MIFDEIIKLPVKVKMSLFKNKELKKQLIENTKFLPEDAGIGERVYCIDNNITEVILCYCGKPVNYLKYSIGYSKRCSKKCACKDQSVIKKRKETCLQKYGVDNFTKTDEYLEKTKYTNNKKYGKDFYLQTNELKEKRIKSNMDKYGVEHHMKSEEFINNIKKLNIDKYGVDNVSKLEFIKEKKRKTFQANYGLNHIFCSNTIKGHFFNKKYGYNPYINKENKKEFDLYKEEVWRLTNKIKKRVIEDWDGKDYYDNEYIKENYKLNYNDNNYPTLDHKVSIYNGFINKIDPSIIADINNIAITKRSINRKKGVLSESDFKSLLH